jgi:nucleolar complex protein 3
LHQLLEHDQDRVASGVYRADIHDPDFCNPFVSACWEFSLLGRHYHPKVASFSVQTASVAPSLPNEYPKALLELYDVNGSGNFQPRIPIPLPHPLYQKVRAYIDAIFDPD